MHAKSTKPHPEAHATLYTTRYASLTVGMLSFWVRQTRSVGEIIELPFRRLIVREGLNSALTVPNMPTFLYEKVAHFFFLCLVSSSPFAILQSPALSSRTHISERNG